MSNRSCWLIVLLNSSVASWFSVYANSYCGGGIEVSSGICGFLLSVLSAFGFHILEFYCLVHTYLGLLCFLSSYSYVMLLSAPGNFLCSKVNLSDITTATSSFFWLVFAWYFFSHPSTFFFFFLIFVHLVSCTGP